MQVRNNKYSFYSSGVTSWTLDPSLQEQALEMPQQFKKIHPGCFHAKNLVLPVELKEAAQIVLDKYPIQEIETRANTLKVYLQNRKRPSENDELQHIAKEYKREKIEKDGIDISSLPTEENEKYGKELENHVLKSLRTNVYNWKPVKYDAMMSMAYLAKMMSINYQSLWQVLNEIKSRDPDFQPKTLFDFGSGLASSVWAVNDTWPDAVQEHYCVDPSQDMNTLARLLLQGGDEDSSSFIYPNVYFRHHMPMSRNTYDIVVSAFSLLELSNQQERLKALWQLWNKTESYLVLVEFGNQSGYTSLMEARSFLLNLSENEQINPAEQDLCRGHVFAPCPHDLDCPLLQLNTNRRKDKRRPCKFEIQCPNLYEKRKSNHGWEKQNISYLVMKKGSRSDLSWPRALQNAVAKKRASNITMCTPTGKIETSHITVGKHGKILARLGKSILARDLIPIVQDTAMPLVDSTLNKESYEPNEEGMKVPSF